MHFIFDLDSTLVIIEGIDELGALKKVKPAIEALTNQAMNGEMSLGDIFVKRLEIIKPSYQDLVTVSKLYLDNISPGALETITTLKARGHHVHMVTGGYAVCAEPVAQYLGIDSYFANRIIFENDLYHQLDPSIPLWQNGGKQKIIDRIRAQKDLPVVMIGDGMSDAETASDLFINFAGVVARPTVAEKAAVVITQLEEVLAIEKHLTVLDDIKNFSAENLG